MDTFTFIVISLAKIGFILAVVLGATVPMMIWIERRMSAIMQDRRGPNRVGPLGLIQAVADVVKLVFKEDVVPSRAHRVFFFLAPVIAIVPAVMSYAVIPFGGETTFGGSLDFPFKLQIANLNVGILYVLAITSLSVYAIALGGWASNNNFSIMGGLRSSAQMVSYEIALGLSLVPIVMMTGSVNLNDIVAAQANTWYIFPGILSFLIFVPSVFAETNRLPFDMPEAEAELVAGYHTEYSGMRFASFFMAEYINMVTASSLIVVLFLGGWQFLPFLSWDDIGLNTDKWFILPVLWFGAKVGFFMLFYVWVRWTLPRLRYDQVMTYNWTRLIPLALLNILIVSIGMLVIYSNPLG